MSREDPVAQPTDQVLHLVRTDLRVCIVQGRLSRQRGLGRLQPVTRPVAVAQHLGRQCEQPLDPQDPVRLARVKPPGLSAARQGSPWYPGQAGGLLQRHPQSLP